MHRTLLTVHGTLHCTGGSGALTCPDNYVPVETREECEHAAEQLGFGVQHATTPPEAAVKFGSTRGNGQVGEVEAGHLYPQVSPAPLLGSISISISISTNVVPLLTAHPTVRQLCSLLPPVCQQSCSREPSMDTDEALALARQCPLEKGALLDLCYADARAQYRHCLYPLPTQGFGKNKVHKYYRECAFVYNAGTGARELRLQRPSVQYHGAMAPGSTRQRKSHPTDTSATMHTRFNNTNVLESTLAGCSVSPTIVDNRSKPPPPPTTCPREIEGPL